MEGLVTRVRSLQRLKSLTKKSALYAAAIVPIFYFFLYLRLLKTFTGILHFQIINSFFLLQQVWVKHLSLVFIYLSRDNLQTARLTVFCIFLLLMKISVISCFLWALFYSAQHYFRLMVDTTQHLIFPVLDSTFSFSNKYWNWPAVIELGSTAGWGEVF